MLGSNRVLNNCCSSRIGGLSPSQNGLMFFANASMRKGGFGRLASVPAGYGSPGAGLAPAVTAGAMSSYKRARITIDGDGDGALGRGMIGSAGITINATAIGGLIAGGVGIASISINATGAIVATIAGVGSATITIGAIANPGALGWLAGNAPITITGTADPLGIGHMVGTTEEVAELTPSGIADAVWQRVIEAGFSAEDIVRLLASVAVGKTSGQPNAPVFRDLADTKARVTATVDASGNRTAIAVDAS